MIKYILVQLFEMMANIFTVFQVVEVVPESSQLHNDCGRQKSPDLPLKRIQAWWQELPKVQTFRICQVCLGKELQRRLYREEFLQQVLGEHQWWGYVDRKLAPYIVSPLEGPYDVFVDWEFFSMSMDLIRCAGRGHLTVDVLWKKNWNLNGAIKS